MSSKHKTILLTDMDGNRTVVTEATHPNGLTNAQVAQIEEGSLTATVFVDGQFMDLAENDSLEPIDAAEDDSEEDDEEEAKAASEAEEDDENGADSDAGASEPAATGSESATSGA